jgi:hypothetical protein
MSRNCRVGERHGGCTRATSNQELNNQEVAELLQGVIGSAGGPGGLGQFYTRDEVRGQASSGNARSFEFPPPRKVMYTDEQSTRLIRDYVNRVAKNVNPL